MYRDRTTVEEGYEPAEEGDRNDEAEFKEPQPRANAQFNAGVKSAATAMENQLDDISANAKPYAEDIARRLKAVFGDGAPSVTDVQNELESQARRARYAVEQAAREVQAEAAADMKAAERLGKEKFGGKDGKEKHGHSD